MAVGNQTSGDQKVSGALILGGASSPAQVTAGSGAIDASNKPNGSLHLRSEANQLPEVLHNSIVANLGLSGSQIEARADDLTANGVMTYTAYMPAGAVITSIRRRYLVAPSSAGGTVVSSITIGGNQILQSGSEDETGVSDDTLTAYTLTGTAADLITLTGAKIVITVTSNNADMAGGTEPIFIIGYDNN